MEEGEKMGRERWDAEDLLEVNVWRTKKECERRGWWGMG